MVDIVRFLTVLCSCVVIMPCIAVGLEVQQGAAIEETAQAVISTQTPRIEIETVELSLGQVVRGEVVEGTFKVRNAGSGVLEIIKVKPG